MNDLQSGAGDDMKNFDMNFCGQIGALGNTMEYILNTQTNVPIFEFRNIMNVAPSTFQQVVEDAEQAIIAYHNTYATAADKVRRQNQHRSPHRDLLVRQAVSCASETSVYGVDATSATSPTITSPLATPTCEVQYEDPDQGINSPYCICNESITAPINTPPPTISFTDPAQSFCYYPTLPGTTVKPIVATTTWTDSCSACTLVGGIADPVTCTSVAGCTPPATPTASVYLAVNNSVSVGTANNNNVTFLHDVYNKLSSLCTGQYVGAYCNAAQYAATMPNISTVNDNSLDNLELGFTIQVSTMSDSTTAQRMLAQGVAAWQQAVSQKCKQVTYSQIINPDVTSCDKIPPLGLRDLTRAAEIRSIGLEPIVSRDGLAARFDCGTASCDPTPQETCTVNTTLCSGPPSFGEFFYIFLAQFLLQQAVVLTFVFHTHSCCSGVQYFRGASRPCVSAAIGLGCLRLRSSHRDHHGSGPGGFARVSGIGDSRPGRL